MYNMHQNDRMREEREYKEFMIKLSDKCRELKEDFDKLSPENKHKVEQAVKKNAAIQYFAALMNNRQ